MKTLFRILVILFAALVVIGVTYVAVNAMPNTGAGRFGDRRPDAAVLGNNANTTAGQVAPQTGQRPERRGGDSDHGGFSVFGVVEVIKNLVIMAVIIAVTAVLSRLKRQQKQSQARAPA